MLELVWILPDCDYLLAELSDDESAVMFFSAIGALVVLLRCLTLLIRTPPLHRPRGYRLALLAVTTAGFIVLRWVLRHWADREVRDDAAYHWLFGVLGIVWLGGGLLGMSCLGLCIRADALERRNPAALIAGCGAIAGLMLIYTGGNIGGGATIWSTILPAALATAVWFGLWVVAEIVGAMLPAVAIDRDSATAFRLAGGLVAAGLILGRAVAGDYVSAEATLHDFLHQGWPALGVMIALAALQLALKPSPARPAPSALRHGLFPGAVVFVASWIYVICLGRWRGHP